MSSTSNSRRPAMETAGRPSKSLREKVLKNTAKTSSSVSERTIRTAELPKVPKAASEPDVTGCETATQHSDATASVFETPTQELCRVSDIVLNWEQCGVSPPHQIVSDDDSSVASSAGGADRPERKSLLYRTPRRGTGVEMDLATREANHLLQKGKDALETAGNMKRECKAVTHECLQGLYETVLSLADSRARHKYNLEKERSRHAQELVRVERAHSREVMALKSELSIMRSDLLETKKEAKGIREWLGHETLDALNGIKELKDEVRAASQRNLTEHEKTRQHKPAEGKKYDPTGEGLSRLEQQMTSMSNQLDVLRMAQQKLSSELTRPKPDSSAPIREIDVLPTARFEEEMEKVRGLLAEIKNKPAAVPPHPQNIDIAKYTQPLAERLEIVSADLRVLRDKEPPIPTPAAPSLDAELAVVEVKRALQKIEKDVADLSKAERPPQQEQGPKTFAQVASTPRTPVTPAKGPNHTLIVSSVNPQHTGDNVIERIRDALDLKATGARVDAVRKARNQKDLTPENPETHQATRPQIYTDGSKIEGKVGAALTWWENGKELKSCTFGLEPHNTVFQSEMYALFRAVEMGGPGAETRNPAESAHTPYHHGETGHKGAILGIRE
ncbi:hypothetical protein HW555_011786 [Spodoptera exigua]|uniref:Uncharacterized protein n=1 Tax=Spodoptera exigua TaxID=7107 RepID=A0A835G8R3_SPOEX|nr:hypothetical protein HW555_011786 [Spodoptera exigua]